jgi:subtilisin family serine protease
MPAYGTYEPGQLLVEFKEGTPESRVQEVHKAVGATPLGEIVPGVWRTQVRPGDERWTIPRFLAFPEVRSAEFNARLHHNMVGPLRGTDLSGRRAQIKVTDPRTLTDKGLPAQWGLRRVDLCTAAGECAAWDRAQGAGIKVAVIDTGVDGEHPDLKQNLVPGINILDGKGQPNDDFGHGTHVSGIIAAAANGLGVVGVAPRAQIIPIRVLGVDGGDTAGLIAGLSFAVKRGARVVNLSLGSTQTSDIEARQMAQAMAANVVVVAAAGNEALAGNPLEYPAAIPGVISVAATRQATDDVELRFQERAAFSNYNPFVSVAAPGVDILSTVPQRPGLTSDTAYAYASGTSMAAPLVSGVVALMLSANPAMSASDVRKRLQATAGDIGDAGFDDYYGWGLVNVPAATLIATARRPRASRRH